ncbi:MAG: hypothetical protein K9I37_10650 [Crocinitomicaceae bacterium]|nr:hypothetical protein [Crocinitomicaceae bacterium]
MNYYTLLFILILGQFSNAQSTSTFFVKNKANEDIKKVYSIGDKITLLLNNSTNSNLKVKGVLNDISIDKIKVDDKWIEVSSIRVTISHGFLKTLIGSVGLAISAAVILINRKKTAKEGGILTQGEKIALAASPIFYASAAVLLIPTYYGSKKFIFKTYLAP